MKRLWMMGVGLLLLAGTVGCVSQGTYDQARRELEAAKNDLERNRLQNDQLNRQIAAFKDAAAKQREEQDKLAAQITMLKEDVVKERLAGEARLKDLDRQVKELTAVKKTLTQERDAALQRYEDALKIQKRQAKELKELGNVQPPTQPAASAPLTEEPKVAEQSGNGSVPPVPPAQPLSLVDVNKATPTELLTILGLAREDADKLVKGRPYRSKDELVTKAGLPKATVDKIQDKIILSP